MGHDFPRALMTDAVPGPTLTEVRAVCGKGDAEPFWISRFLIRPWTPVLSYLALRLGLRPSQITVASAVFAVSAGFIAVWPSRWSYVAGAVLTISFFILDHVDGEMARVIAVRATPPGGVRDISGKYLDRLVHYFQAPTLFLGITIGVAVAERQPLWGLVGMICAVGSSGFPRFTASYDLLVVASRSRTDRNRQFLERAAGFNMVYGDTLEGRPFVVFPRTLAQATSMGRQYVGFPGSLFVVSAALLIDGIRMPAGAPVAVKLVTGAYAVILLGNLLFATRKYFKLLTEVPE